MEGRAPCISHLVPAKSLGGRGALDKTSLGPPDLTHDSNPDAGGEGLLFFVLRRGDEGFQGHK